MKLYQTGNIKQLLKQTYENRSRRGYSEFTALTVAELKVIDLIRLDQGRRLWRRRRRRELKGPTLLPRPRGGGPRFSAATR